MKFFILGANDPEMREIVQVLTAAGENFAYACQRGVRVRATNAYDANSLSAPLPKDVEIVFVECSVRFVYPAVIVDHHQPGHPGFDCAPADYLKGSSLGQVLALLGKEPTELQRIICAADHCPDAAYRGECPGVVPAALADWRLESKAAVKGLDVEELRRRVEEQRVCLQNAERIDIAGTLVAWMPESTDETPDAAARYGIPFMYRTAERDGREKLGILGAPPAAIEAWMAACGLQGVYGCPSRGYAGGYR
jgi:hypothetical protein